MPQLLTCSWTLVRGFADAEGQALSVVVLDCCVFALLLTGPLGALLSSKLAPKLLRRSALSESLPGMPQHEADMSF